MNYESSSIVGDGGNERRVAAHVKVRHYILICTY